MTKLSLYGILLPTKDMIKTSKNTLNLAEKLVLYAVFVTVLGGTIFPQTVAAAGLPFAGFFSIFQNNSVITNPMVIKKTLNVVATAYSSTPDQTDGSPFETSNGMWVYDGLLAVNGLPYGTKIRIPDIFGEKIFTVNDRMNARYNSNRIDIWLPSRAAAIQFGAKHVRIQLVENEA